MSLSTALNNAYSGLSVMSKSAETVSNNVSNALTEGYSRQRVEYSASVVAGTGSGVVIEGIYRSQDAYASRARLGVDAEVANLGVLSNTTARLAGMLGEPGNPTALATQYQDLETALSTAINAPDSVALQQGILFAAKEITASFSRISTETTQLRTDAESAIAKDIANLNGALKNIENLNETIRNLTISGHSVASLEDQRQTLIDNVNAIVPIRTVLNERGETDIFTRGGAVLLNGSAAELEFTQTSAISPSMTLSSGALSGISINGKPVELGAQGGVLAGGSLAAHLDVRDRLAPLFQTQLDALAADLIMRFQTPVVDPTLGAGDAGIFTDAGGSFDTLNQVGISQRVSINIAVDPSTGGQLWRIRDGLGAGSPGVSGTSEQLIRMTDSMKEIVTPPLGIGITSSLSGTGFAEEFTSAWAMHANLMEADHGRNQGRLTVLKVEEQNAIGVDTDQEMQSLLNIENAYSANARVISVLDDLMQKLLEI